MVDVRQGRYVLKDPEQRPRPLGQAVVASSRGDGPRYDVAHVGETGCIEAGAGTRSSFASKAGSREAEGRRAARRQRGKALRCARRPGVGESGSANAPGSKRSAKQRRDRRRGLARHGARNGAVRKTAHWGTLVLATASCKPRREKRPARSLEGLAWRTRCSPRSGPARTRSRPWPQCTRRIRTRGPSRRGRALVQGPRAGECPWPPR